MIMFPKQSKLMRRKLFICFRCQSLHLFPSLGASEHDTEFLALKKSSFCVVPNQPLIVSFVLCRYSMGEDDPLLCKLILLGNCVKRILMGCKLIKRANNSVNSHANSH